MIIALLLLLLGSGVVCGTANLCFSTRIVLFVLINILIYSFIDVFGLITALINCVVAFPCFLNLFSMINVMIVFY